MSQKLKLLLCFVFAPVLSAIFLNFYERGSLHEFKDDVFLTAFFLSCMYAVELFLAAPIYFYMRKRRTLMIKSSMIAGFTIGFIALFIVYISIGPLISGFEAIKNPFSSEYAIQNFFYRDGGDILYFIVYGLAGASARFLFWVLHAHVFKIDFGKKKIL